MEITSITAFGKIWIRFRNDGREIRLPLHFLVEKSNDGFDALCLELTSEGFGATPRESVAEMLKDVAFFISHSSRADFLSRYSEDFNAREWQIFRSLYAKKAFEGSPHPKLDALADLVETVRCVIKDLENADLDIDIEESDFTTVQKAA